MPETFDPASFPALAHLSGQLPQLAGENAYKAGRDYFRKGLVREGTVAGASAHATVAGSTNYRVRIALEGEVKGTCTCPAHRRNRFCKHVVAVCLALLEAPSTFTVGEPSPEPEIPKRKRRSDPSPRKPNQQELRTAGLETVDRLLSELADGGLLTLGSDKANLLSEAGERVRALKLRRLGSLLLALERSSRSSQSPLEPAVFADLLSEIHTIRPLGAFLEGRLPADGGLADELLGRTLREGDLEPVAGLELMEMAFIREEDGEFWIDTSFLADSSTGTLYLEKQITPLKMSSRPRPRQRCKVLLDEGGLYPGSPPRRIRLGRMRRAPLAREDVDRLFGTLPTDLPALRRRLLERLEVPFGPQEVPVLFRPAELVRSGEAIGARDREGRFLPVEWPVEWTKKAGVFLRGSQDLALCGMLGLEGTGLRLRCLSILSSDPGGEYRPVFDG